MPSKKSSTSKKTSSLKLLTTKLKRIESAFNDIWRFTEKIQESTTATQIILRLEKIDELWERYSATLVEIESHEDFDDEDDEEDPFDKQRQEFSDRYYEAKSILTDQLRERQEPITLNQSIRGGEPLASTTFDRVRLPQIKLQTFNGEIDEWMSFRDLFTSLIHWKTDLPEVEKFHYLKGCLQGEPKTLIDSLQITAANYQVAWGMLTKRYNNSKQLKKRQIQSLLKLPILAKESANDLHNLVEGFEKIVQTLNQIVQPVDYKDLLLVNLLTSRLDPSTRRGWEEFSSTKEQDTLKELVEFLQRRVRILESLPSKAADVSKPSQHPQPLPRHKSTAVKTSFNTVQTSGGRCVACSGNHPLFQCGTFQRMSVTDKDSLLRSHSLCRNCFRQGHQAKECQSKYSCRNCKGQHHTLVCFKLERDSNTRPSTKSSNVSKEASESTFSSSQSASTSTLPQVANLAATDSLVAGTAHQCSSRVLLATAVVVVQDDDGNRMSARALLDSGSESNFISERLSQRLKVTRRKVDISILGIGQAATKVKQRITATIRSRISDFSRQMSFLVLPKVTLNLPTTTINTAGWTFPEGIELADPSFCVSSGVDLVLGIEAFFDFFDSGRKISLGERLPALQDSVFGWVVSGGFPEVCHSLQINCNMATTDRLEELLSQFWSIEEVESTNNFSPEETHCEALFANTVQRRADGRYTVSLPKDENVIPRLGESMEIAFRRFQGTERRLSKDAKLREQYVAFMEEYVQLGHMRKVEGDQGTLRRCFLPHHPVVREASTTTKVRVVFDASCKTSTGLSLNDALLVGPVIQQDLRSIILRCCTKQIMLVADVEKMFRQIFITSEDRKLQSILWRPSPAEEVGVYELNTITYGTKPAPFLATRTLNQLAMDEGERYPLAVRAITEDTYMDDVITGCDTLEEVKELQSQLDKMTISGGFQLRKWASNCAEVLHGISESNLAIRTEGINLDPDPSIKALGLTWLPNSDVFRFQFEIPPINPGETLTKRQVLSIIATLFDPLGFIGATITAAKVFMQLLWTLQDENGKGLNWDQPLPSTVGESRKKFHVQLPILNDVRIERCVIIPQAVQVEIHCFSDASQKAYGGCVYIRSQDQDGNVKVQLLTSKSKVAPLKTQSIPRLELCGALLAAQIYEKVQHATKFQVRTTFWVDSTCALRWIQASPSIWSVFVANRVAKIQAITDGCEWRHVAGADNPADLISRGIGPQEILHNNFWWQGPSWLAQDRNKWPTSSDVLSGEESEEERRRTAVVGTASAVEEFNEWFISSSSSYTVLIRRTAIWLRLIRTLRTPKEDRPTGFLTSEELRQAEFTIIRKVQEEAFSEELRAVRRNESVSRRSPLRWFNPFICRNSILRVGGRLRYSEESDDTKHPMILPVRHRCTRLIFNQYHLRLLHAGPQLLLGSIRQRYWPLGGRNVARQVVQQCLKCFRSKPKLVQQFMGELPASRVTASRPFSKTGVDFFGPVYIRPGPRRNAVKAYVEIFVCMCTKAVHIELVSDLSTDRFLQALRRFIARRGRCTDLFSDNGTNFVGARNQLQELFRLLKNEDHRQQVARFCSDERINWHFNPPSAPHFGGLWEAAVRSAKHHILRVIGYNPVALEDMYTLLTQVEGCLNSRPLTPMSDDPGDLEPLTPAHFLIGTSLQSFPEEDLRVVPTNRLKHWQVVQQQLQHFWERWRREYLCQLQGRSKRWCPPAQIQIGRLVVIKDDNQPPMRWRMGRIVDVHPGSDGVVRVVTIKTAFGELKRPVEKICLLPVPESADGH